MLGRCIFNFKNIKSTNYGRVQILVIYWKYNCDIKIFYNIIKFNFNYKNLAISLAIDVTEMLKTGMNG